MKILTYLRVQDHITLLNAALGLVSIFLSLHKMFFPAAIVLLAGVVCDHFDGYIARKRHKAHEFGKQLDSLCDVISFGVAPAVFGFSLIDFSVFTTVVFVFFLLCGILRLARFNVSNVTFYEGLPITINGVLIPVLYFFNAPFSWYPYFFIVSGLLMVSSFKVMKRK
jgi:CDP-diacylglycerol---serine O-phosphatidyltransferase